MVSTSRTHRPVPELVREELAQKSPFLVALRGALACVRSARAVSSEGHLDHAFVVLESCHLGASVPPVCVSWSRTEDTVNAP